MVWVWYGIALWMDGRIGWTGDVLMNFHFKNSARQDRDYISHGVIATSVFVFAFRWPTACRFHFPSHIYNSDLLEISLRYFLPASWVSFPPIFPHFLHTFLAKS